MLMIAVVVVLSLLPPRDIPAPPVGNDKLGHFLAYFFLMAGAVQLHARKSAWLVMALLLVLLGVGLEHAQGAMHLGRTADRMDALANTLGVLAGFATGFTPLRDLLLRIDGGRR
ncbi:VanZ family protein [Solilutibacter pythonis]|nr:VanZ family protein [Lysobacter pythonis]